MKNSITQELNLIELVERMRKTSLEKNKINKDVIYKCNICKDVGLVLKDEVTNTYTDCICKSKNKINNLWENFGVKIDEIKLLKDYEEYNEETKNAKRKAVKYIKSFNEKNTFWFCLFGASGSGKTHICKAIGKALINKNVPVVYISYIEAIRKLKSLALDESNYLKLITKYKKARVLIIDDLFKEKIRNGKIYGQINEADLKQIYIILNYRYQNNLATVISTECTPKLLFELDEALAGRILEKCGKQFGQIFTYESNYRIKSWNRYKTREQETEYEKIEN